MPKINAQVPEETREDIRVIAGEYQTTVQSVTALAVQIGLREMLKMTARKLRNRLQPDGRRKV